ncbi:MAG: hypothetical protein KOO60_10540 [Gemmatimonadales bacterium]|nr:hypothetical protein [Gemmatimonadales bacterium]
MHRHCFLLTVFTAVTLFLCTGRNAVAGNDGRAELQNDILQKVNIRLETSVSGFVFTNDGMSDAYSSILLHRTGLTMDISQSTQFLISAGYGRKTKSMEINDPTFEMDQDLKLKLVPIQLGFRYNTSRLNSFRINLGAFVQAIWMKESVPYFQTYPFFDAGIDTDTCWGQQVLISLGPEWRFPDHKWVVGVEGMLSANGGDFDGSNQRELDMSGFSGRLYFSYELGVIQEGPDTPEVQP